MTLPAVGADECRSGTRAPGTIARTSSDGAGMSFVIASSEALGAAAEGLADVGSVVTAANAAAAGSTTSLAAAAGDEVSTAVAALFGSYAREYQALGARA